MPENILHLKIFQGITPGVVENLILSCAEKSCIAGEIILTEWAQTNWEGYIIKHGSVGVKMGGKQIARLEAWEMFWEMALLNEDQRTASVQALSDTTLIILSLDNLIDMINNDENKINKEIMRRMEENLENS